MKRYLFLSQTPSHQKCYNRHMAKELAKKPTSAVKTTKPTVTKTVEYRPADDNKNPGDDPVAITSMVLGVVSLTALGPITGIPAVILGIIGLNRSSKKGLSIAGIVTGSISILITLFVAMLLLFVIVLAASDTEYYEMPSEYTPNQSVYKET